MGANSKIEWTTHTFNPWRGCTKVAPECANCYADAQSKRNPSVLGVWGPNGTRVVAAESTWREPIKWNHEAEQAGERRRVFCASLGDVFEDWSGDMLGSNGKPVFVCECGRYSQLETERCEGCRSIRGSRIATMADVRRRVFELIDATPWLDWLLLTKRPENIRRMWPLNPSYVRDDESRSNVWLLTSAGTQETADEFIPELLRCRDLAPVLGLSIEPLLGPVDLRPAWNRGRPWLSPAEGIGWVIVGGESGHHARPCHPDWVRSIRDQCTAAGVPFFFKQWGEWVTLDQSPACEASRDRGYNPGFCRIDKDGKPDPDAPTVVYRFGKKAAGRLLDGREWNESPSVN